MNKIVVRKLQERDVEDVVEIFAADGLIHNEEERDRTRKRLKRTASEPVWYDHFLVAEMDGRVVGRVILEAAYPPYSELINLYVLPKYQGIGVGSRLVKSCIRTASSKKCFLMSAMADPVGNLPAHRLYSKFGLRPGILGDPSVKRGHMWLFRFSKESCISEFLKKHPFAEPSVSPSKLGFHDQMLYRMSWRDPQTEDKIDLFIEGQPSQTPDGTAPRIAGLSYKEKDLEIEALVKEQNRTIRRGETSGFTTSFWNLGSKPLQTAFNFFIPNGAILSPLPENLSPIEIDPRNEKTIQFEFTWSFDCRLPDFTTFPTILATCCFTVEGLKYPFFISAGFEKK
jgi:GNAT superfamily N-acetyltransferase